MKQSVRLVICACAFVLGMITLGAQTNDTLVYLNGYRVFPYDFRIEKVWMNFAFVDSTFIFGLYEDGTILSGPTGARIQRTLLSTNASVFVPDTDTLLALDCGGLWLLPIGSDEPRTRIMTVDLGSRFVKAIDHGFALRRGGKVYVHHGYASEPSDSIEHPETNDYWSVSADGKRSASWGLGPTTATVQWSVGDVEPVDLSTNLYSTCAVLSDSVIAVWNSNLLISRDRGRTWHHYRTTDIDPSLPAEEITYRSFRSVEVRGTDIYVQFVPEKLTEMYHYISSDLGLTWRRYTPATAPVHTNAIPYRSGIASVRNAAGVRFVTDTDGTRIVESLCEIQEAEYGGSIEYSIVGQNVSVTDTLYTWNHSLDSCIAFDPGADSTTSWIWFSNGLLLTKQRSGSTYTEWTLPTSPLLSCWVVDSVTAIIKGEEGAHVTHDAGATWTADSTYDGLLAFTPLLNETQLSLWRTATAGLEIRSSDSISPKGTLVASLPNTEASQYMISRNGASGCVVQAVDGSEWTSLSIENFTDPGSNEQFTDHMVRFADSLTTRLGTGPQLNVATIIPRIHEEHGWVFGISNDAEVGLRQYAIPVGVAESTSIQSTLSVFPNPAKDQCVIRSTDGTEITSIQVYSSIGTLVLSQSPNGPEARLDTSTLPSGVYHLSVFGPVIGHTSSRICITP